mgnify:CR=1 FL=1
METFFMAILGIILLIIEYLEKLVHSYIFWIFIGAFFLIYAFYSIQEGYNQRISRLEDNLDSRLEKIEDEIKKIKFVVKRIADESNIDLPENDDDYYMEEDYE